MKVFDKKDKIIAQLTPSPNDDKLPEDVKNDLEFHASRTVFWKSLLALIICGIGPFLLLFFLTSPDLVFTTHYEVGAGIGLGFAMIISVFLLTLLGYILKLFNYDQFTYNITVSWTLYGIYLTGYWWNWDYALYRSLVALGFLLVAVFFGTFIAMWIRNLTGLWKNRHQKLKLDDNLPVENSTSLND